MRTNYDLSKIDTIMISRVYTDYYDEKVLGFRRNKASEETSWMQIPKKIQRKLNEFGVTVVPMCDSIDSVHRYLPDARISKNRENNEAVKEYLDLFEKKEYK